MTDKDIQANYEILENVSKNIEINILIKIPFDLIINIFYNGKNRSNKYNKKNVYKRVFFILRHRF